MTSSGLALGDQNASTDLNQEWDETVDVVVVGSGFADHPGPARYTQENLKDEEILNILKGLGRTRSGAGPRRL